MRVSRALLSFLLSHRFFARAFQSGGLARPFIYIYSILFPASSARQIEKFRNINSPRGQTRITRLPGKPARWIPVLLEQPRKLSWEQFFLVSKLLHIDVTYAEEGRRGKSDTGS